MTVYEKINCYAYGDKKTFADVSDGQCTKRREHFDVSTMLETDMQVKHALMKLQTKTKRRENNHKYGSYGYNTTAIIIRQKFIWEVIFMNLMKAKEIARQYNCIEEYDPFTDNDTPKYCELRNIYKFFKPNHRYLLVSKDNSTAKVKGIFDDEPWEKGYFNNLETGKKVPIWDAVGVSFYLHAPSLMTDTLSIKDKPLEVRLETIKKAIRKFFISGGYEKLYDFSPDSITNKSDELSYSKLLIFFNYLVKNEESMTAEKFREKYIDSMEIQYIIQELGFMDERDLPITDGTTYTELPMFDADGQCIKYYKYSLKNLLTYYFVDNTVFSMRCLHESQFDCSTYGKYMLQLAWQHADKEILYQFLESDFLIDTIIEDDYIVYTLLRGNKKMAYLTFIAFEDESAFAIDVQYAKKIIGKWTDCGYETYILCKYICFEKYKGRFNFRVGTTADLYELRKINGKDILIFSTLPCWTIYDKKLISVSRSDDIREYECLFSDDVVITTGEKSDKKTIGSGISSVKNYLSNSKPLSVAYTKYEDTHIYSRFIIEGDSLIEAYINSNNLIAELNIVSEPDRDNIIIDTSDNSYGSLVDCIPKLLSVRALNPGGIYGYAIQCSYADNSVRNYYLTTFDSRIIPVSEKVNDTTFTEDILKSATIDSNQNIVFSNGYCIPKHILFYHSYRQVVAEKRTERLCNKSGINIESYYRLPLTKFHSNHYLGNKYEYYGPKQAYLDSNGDRISDMSFLSFHKGELGPDSYEVCIEHTKKYGYIRKNGTWLIPPIYDNLEEISDRRIKGTRAVNGEETNFVLIEDGEEKPFEFPYSSRNIENNRCAFNAEKWEGRFPNAGYYCDHYVEPGKWGFTDSDGNVIVEPKYVYAAGFSNGGRKHSVVARYVDGELCWGVIDLDGNETIPCTYPELYCRWGEAVIFRDEHWMYGLMDFDGKIICEPIFDYIEEYNSEHRLVTVGEDEDSLGVYSLNLHRMLIEPEYDYVDYGKHIICCEICSTGKFRYFDYNGKELLFTEYDSVYETDGVIKVHKDGKIGFLDFDGNVVIPPVLQDNYKSREQYMRGFIVTGTDKLQGVSKVTGEEILPIEYSHIEIYDKLMVASKCTDNGRSIKDTLFTLDGTLLIDGPFRNMHINDEKDEFTVETPKGKLFCTIEYQRD